VLKHCGQGPESWRKSCRPIAYKVGLQLPHESPEGFYKGGGTIRVSIINPKAKKRKAKKRKAHRSPKQKAASKRNIKKARAARRGSHAKKGKKARKGKRKTKKARKAKKRKSKKKARKSRKGQTRKQRAASLRNLKKARAARKGGKGKRKGRKSKARRGKKVRPTMYKGRTRKGKKVLRHSPRSRYARRGYRFNPADAVKGVMPVGVRKYMPDMRGARVDIPHVVGGVMGFITSGYGGGMMRVVVQNYSTNEYIGHGASLLGNIVGTEIPTIVVDYAMKRVKGLSANADKVARGMRIGGYVAMGINGVIIALKVLKVGNLPFRIPSQMSPTKELILNGLGDIDLVGAGLGNMVQGLGNGFVSSQDYAGLSDAGLLDTEISALSAYVGETLDDFSGLPVNDRGLTP